MPAAGLHVPDVLVLGGGGTLGEAWMRGLAAGAHAEGGVDLRESGAFVGTSAGSIVAAMLAAGVAPEASGRKESRPAMPGARPPRVLGLLAAGARVPLAAAGALTPLWSAGHERLGPAARAAALRRGPCASRSLTALGREVDRRGAKLDGRLLVATVDRASGRRVVFGAAGAPEATAGQAVMASCAVPWIFAPVEIGGREYVDGGVWSPTNLDVAPAPRGGHVLMLNPTAALPGPLRTASRAAAGVEALALRRRGVRVRAVAPDAASARAMGLNLMDPRRSAAVLGAAYEQGRALASGDS